MTDTHLPSWSDVTFKQKVKSFLADTTNPDSTDFVPVSDRIAVFDHDGTLWVEKPIMTQIEFIRGQFDELDSVSKAGSFIDSIEASVSDIFNDIAGLSKEFIKGLSLQEYHDNVLRWLSVAKHPRFGCAYTDLFYQPMRELIDLLQQHDFQCFIVSGGTSAFIRPWCETTYNIAKQNVIGSSLRTHVVERSGKIELEYLPVPFYFANGDAKVRSIGRVIGKQPIVAFGNTDGDVEMLRYTQNAKRSLVGLIHHTDEVREYKYSPDSFRLFGESTLSKAENYGWHVVDMKTDWQTIFAHH